MAELTASSRIIGYILITLLGVFTLTVWWAQVEVLRGGAFRNPDGTVDDWHEQRVIFGISLADVFLACPAGAAGIVLTFLSPRWGYYLLALVSFWFLWANTMTTATSLRFERPRITLQWMIVFPLGAVIGLAYIVWTFIHFDAIYGL